MDEKDLKKLYEGVSSNFDIGDYDTFKSKMTTTEDRKKFYDVVNAEGFDLGDYDTYENRLKKKDSTESNGDGKEITTDSDSQKIYKDFFDVTPRNKEVSTEADQPTEPEEPLAILTDDTKGLIDTSEMFKYNQEAVDIYDNYKESVKLSKDQQAEIFEEVRLDSGETKGLKNKLEKEYKRKLSINFIEELPDSEREALREYKMVQSNKLSGDNLNLLSENKFIENKFKQQLQSLTDWDSLYKKRLSEGADLTEEELAQQNEDVKKYDELVKDYTNNLQIIESNSNDLGDIEEELDLFKRNYGALYNFGKKLDLAAEEAVVNIEEFALDFLKISDFNYYGTFDNLIEKRQATRDKQREVIESKKRFLQPNKSFSSIENLTDFGQWSSEMVATQVPNIITMAALGEAGLIAMGAAAGGSRTHNLKEQVKEGEIELTDEQVVLSGSIDMGAEIAGEIWTLGLLKGGGRVIRSAFSDAVGEVGKKSIKSGIKEYVTGAIGEGVSEDFTQLMQNANSRFYLDDKSVELTDGMLEAFAGGVFLGTAMTVSPALVGESIKFIRNKKNKDIVSNNYSEMKLLGKALKEIEADSPLREPIIDRIKAIVKENKGILKQEIKDIESKTPDELQKIVDVDSQIEKSKEQRTEIVSSDKLSNESKQPIIESLDKKIEKLEDTKENLLAPKETLESITELIEKDLGKNFKEEDLKGHPAEEKYLELKLQKEGVETKTKKEVEPQKDTKKPQEQQGQVDTKQKEITEEKKEVVEPKGEKKETQEKQDEVKDKSKKDEVSKKQDRKVDDVTKQKTKEVSKEREVTEKNGEGKPTTTKGNKKATDKPTESELTEKGKNRKSVEADVDKMINDNLSDSYIISSFDNKNEKMLAEDYLTRKKDFSNKEAMKIVDKAFDKAQREMSMKRQRLDVFKQAMRSIASKVWDRQYLPKMLLMKAGGKVVRNYMINSKGAAGVARYEFDKAYDKIYKGLSSKDVKTLDKIIQLRRFISIDKNRAENNLPDVVHPDFINKKISESALEEINKQLGDKKYKQYNKKADEYFNVFRELLNDMESSGIISKELKDSFFGVDYQPRVFLDFLKTAEQESSILERGAEESKSLASAQIKRLESGSSSSLITDSEYLLSRSLNTRSKTVAMNNTNKRLIQFMEDQKKVVDALKKKKNPTKKEKKTIRYFNELSTRVKDNPIIGFTKSGNPKYKYKAKEGQKTQTYYKDGVKHQIIMEESFFNQYTDNIRLISNELKEKIAIGSLTALVKTLATGNNPAFFITNSPRDLMFISTFSEVYGGFVPLNMAKISKDLYQGIQSIRKDDNTFQKFVKYGGMMDYLHKQGQFKGTTALNNMISNNIGHGTREKFKKVANAVTLKDIQMWSEMGFRIGVFNRSIKKQMSEMGVKNEAEIKSKYGDDANLMIDDMYHNAVSAARNTTDFNQGGTVVKAADAGIPYLNAGVQGVRVGIENLHERPVETTFRMAQSAAIMSAVPIGLSLAAISLFRGGENEPDEDKDLSSIELYLKARSGVSQYDRTNYMTIFTGRRTKDGEFEFYRVAKPHFMTPMTSFVEEKQIDIMKYTIGDTSPSKAIDNVKFAFEKNISPIEFSVTGNLSRTPLIKAAMTYSTGYDFYRNQDLSRLRNKVPVAVEGFESKGVEEFYKAIGEYGNISPARMKGAVESIITTPSTTPFVGALYGGLDFLSKDEDAKSAAGSLIKDLGKSTVNRVVKETSDFNRRINFDKLFNKEFTKIEIENIRNKQLFKDLTKKYRDKEISANELFTELVDMAKKSPFDAKRMANIIKSGVSNPSVSSYVYEIKYSNPKQKALMIAELFGDTFFSDVKGMSKYNKKLANELYSNEVIDAETTFEYNKLINSKE